MTVAWDGAVTGTSTGITGVDGKVTMGSPKTRDSSGTIVLRVTDIVKDGYDYQPTAPDEDETYF